MPTDSRKALSTAALVLAAALMTSLAWADPILGPAQVVDIATEVNPQVRAARDRWYSAMHQIRQNYAPADPILGYANVDSATNGFDQASLHALSVTMPLQFPGKAMLQADKAKRSAEIARLTYEATLRDVRAQTETAYYQILLDGALADVQAETVRNLDQVLKVTQVAYSANQVTQTDFISAEFDLAAARQNERQLRTSELNDETTLNQLLLRRPGEMLDLDRRFQLKPIEMPLDKLTDLATLVRQEILETALAEGNSETGLALAKFEYAPDYTIGYTFVNYLLSSAAPSANGRMQDHGFLLSFNAPFFFWIKQAEDVKRAEFDLSAASEDLASIRSQTAAGVTTLYRTAELAYGTSMLYRDSLIPLANEDFQVALVAYQTRRIDFVALAGALRRGSDARVAYLQAANQFLATRVALEQAIGQPLP